MSRTDQYDNAMQKVRKALKERMENLWECSDSQVLDLIDQLLLEQSRRDYLTIEDRTKLRTELFHAVRKMDVLEELLQDDTITEIMVNGWQHIFIEREGKIHLEIREEEEKIVICVRDNGKGMSRERIEEVLSGHAGNGEEQSDSTGIGMNNVISRLELFYDRKGLMQIYSGGLDQGTEVVLTIPKITGGEEACTE